MANWNKCQIMGYLGRDPEMKVTPQGKTLAQLSIATTEGEKTVWHKVVAFDKVAEIFKAHLAKGMPIFVEGRLAYRRWEKNGVKLLDVSIIVNSFQFIGGKKSVEPDEPDSVEVPF